MKKFMFVVLTLFISLLSFTKVCALATLNTEETSVGSIKVSLSFKEGYVGAVDASIKVQGNVDVSSLVWNNSLSAYTKRYSYDANSKVIRIIISTGDSSKNLLDKYGNLNIGELKLSNSTNSSQSYSFSIMDVDMVDAEYKTNTNLSVSDGSLGEYIIKVDNNPITPSDPSVPDYGNNDDSNSNGSNSSNNYNPVSPSDNVDNNFDEEDNEQEPNENLQDDDNEDKEKEESNSKPIINDNKNSGNKDNDSESNDAMTHNQKIVRYLWIILGGLIVVAIILAGVYAKKQNKLRKMQ